MPDKDFPSQLQTLNKDTTFSTSNQVLFALNGIKDSHDGGKPEYQSEPGNTLAFNLPDDCTIIGNTYMKDNKVCVFYTNNSSSHIGLVKDGILSEIVSSSGGDFNTLFPITAEYRVKNGCDEIVYWCDKHNDDRYFNFNRPDDFKTGGDWDWNKFKFTPDIQVPFIDLERVNDEGGNLYSGNYRFQLEILDKNSNVVYKTDITPQTLVYEESQSDVYSNINGNLNYPQYDPLIGGVPITNKSITLHFQNVDTTFNYLRLIVIRETTSNNIIDAHVVGKLIPITSSNLMFTYTGYNPANGDYLTDFSASLIDDIRYANSYVMEQVQGRLLRANVSEKNRDYSTYQATASQIGVKWISKKIKQNDAFALGDAKNPMSYWYLNGFQGDEITPLSIQYLHPDGTWSPNFHIIGNCPKKNDRDIMTIISNEDSISGNQFWQSDVEHIPPFDFTFWNGDYVGSTIERWKVVNTAEIIDTPHSETDIWESGTMSYYECPETYPDIRDCNGNLIWGVDRCDTTIDSSMKIRHFKMPDRRLVPLDDGFGFTYALGIRCDNINLPSDTVGYRICRAEKNDFNKTVLDSGYYGRIPDGYDPPSNVILQWFKNHNDSNIGTKKTASFLSSNVVFNDKIFVADYIKNNKILEIHVDSKGAVSDNSLPMSSGPSALINIFAEKTSDIASMTFQNHKINNQLLLKDWSYSAYDTNISSKTVLKSDFLTNCNLIEVNSELEDATLKIAESVPNPFGTPPDFIDQRYSINYAYKKVYKYPFGNLFDINYNYCNFNYYSGTSIDTFNGGTIITLNACTNTITYDILEGVNCVIAAQVHSSFYEEQSINSSLRIEGIGSQYSYCKIDKDPTWLLNKVADKQSDTKWKLRPIYYKEYYRLNSDYDLFQKNKLEESLPLQYEYCSECRNYYPNRIIFSPKSFDEEKFDLYRINKVNDYIEIPANRGEITGLKYKNNQLLVHTKDSTFIVQPSPQELATDTNSAYLTTGDFLSLPPQEFLQTDLGYAGCQSKQHQCDTPNGWCWIDQNRGGIFLYSGQIENLSDKSLGQWFKENLPSDVKKEFDPLYSQEYPFASTYDVNGYGIIMYYDPRFKRLMISKKDFKPINLSNIEGLGVLYFNPDTYWNYGVTQVAFGNTSYFENKSWTISFGFEYDAFISWHSYRPVSAFSDTNHYYTSKKGETGYPYMYQHLDKGNYQTYYGSKKDFIIEWMIFGINTFTSNTVEYIAYTLQWDDTNKQWVEIPNVTFNKGLFYNNLGSTGLQTLTYLDQSTNPYGNVSIPNNSKYVIKTDQNYKISGLYDMSVGKPFNTADWSQVKLYGDYIDMVQHPTNIDMTKNPYQFGNLKDKFLTARLYFKPSSDYKILLILQNQNNQLSIR